MRTIIRIAILCGLAYAIVAGAYHGTGWIQHRMEATMVR